MNLLESDLDKLAADIKQLEKQREVFGKSISNIKEKLVFPLDDPDILENKFVFNVNPSELSELKIAAIDGGIVNSHYHGVDLLLGRAAAVLFEYKNGKLVESNYFPDPFPTPTPLAYTKPSSNREFAINISLERQKMEVSLAARTADKFAPDVLLMDGSIIPQTQDKPTKDSQTYSNYVELIQAYTTLYETCKSKNTLLAGVVEDSSGLRLAKLLEMKIVPGIIKSSEFETEIMQALNQTKGILSLTKDSNLLYYILGVGERSCTFSYTKDPSKHQVLRDLESWSSKVSSFYLKPVEFDRPLRIDFLDGGEKNADKIASIVLALSQHNETYGYPSVLIEADARAKLSEDDLEMIYHKLKDKVGDLPSLFKLRRELRPF